MGNVINALSDVGIQTPIGATPELRGVGSGPDERRATEIRAWLASNSHLVDRGRWVAIDDVPLDQYLPMEHVVVTDSYIGLTLDLANNAIDRLAVRDGSV